MENDLIVKEWKENGFVRIENLLDHNDIKLVSDWYDAMLSDLNLTRDHRRDLLNEGEKGKEKITQIMRPSLLDDRFMDSDIIKKVEEIAKIIIGEDAALDFDMLINKVPHSNAETPWHQDMAYWPQLEDKRAASFWIAIDDAVVENGCMAYIPGSHKLPMRLHVQKIENAALSTNIEHHDVIVNGELKSGSSIAHHGNTMHFANGNVSDRNRRAWILNFRPQSMIKKMRSLGYDHLGKKKNKS